MDKYEEFRKILDSDPAGAPESPAFSEILRILFTEEDIDLLLHMNFAGKSASEIAAVASISVESALARLEAMADRGVLFHRDKGEERFYGILGTIPGLFEYPFMKRDGTAMPAKLALLWDEYKREGQAKSFAGNPTPLMRVIPVNKSIDTRSNVFSHDEVSEIINNADYIAIGGCACRISLKKCDKPTDVCILFGSIAKFLVKRNFAKHVDKAEALDALDRSEKAGLVHCCTNTKENAAVICNCCSCCCTILRGRSEFGFANTFVPSRFTAFSDSTKCTGCETCIHKRCPAKAIDMIEKKAVVGENKCIGCGLCVTGCKFSAMRLIDRTTVSEIPTDGKELVFQVLKEKGKLDSFMKNLKK